MDQYDDSEGETLGSGGFSEVMKAIRRSDGTVWAIKKIELDNLPHLSKAIFREACFMHDIAHPNIARIESSFLNGEEICFVMKPYERTLGEYLKTEKFKPRYPACIPVFLGHILSAIAYLHDKGIMHRDLKTANVMVDTDGDVHVLKLIDFGLARGFGGSNGDLTPQVGSFMTMAPEILLGSTSYTIAADMWSVGCILAEMAIEEDLFFGDSDTAVLRGIFSKIGTPSEHEWPEVSQLPNWGEWIAEFPSSPAKELVELDPKLKRLGDTGLKLLMRFLTLNPAKRITAAEALKDEFLKRSVE